MPAPKLVIDKQPMAPDRSLERDAQPTGTGSVTEAQLSEEDQKRERIAFGSSRRRRVDPPAWFAELAKTKAPPGKVVEALLERLPQIEDVELVRMMVNELGRTESASAVLRRTLTPEVAARLNLKGVE